MEHRASVMSSGSVTRTPWLTVVIMSLVTLQAITMQLGVAAGGRPPILLSSLAQSTAHSNTRRRTLG